VPVGIGPGDACREDLAREPGVVVRNREVREELTATSAVCVTRRHGKGADLAAEAEVGELEQASPRFSGHPGRQFPAIGRDPHAQAKPATKPG
jgi:hypothetical protein